MYCFKETMTGNRLPRANGGFFQHSIPDDRLRIVQGTLHKIQKTDCARMPQPPRGSLMQIAPVYLPNTIGRRRAERKRFNRACEQ